MICYFPEIYPDELLYSQLSRYYSKSGYMAYIFAAQELFMDKHVRPDIEFVNRFTTDALNVITGNISINDIVTKHTMFPYYGRFLKSDRREKAYSALVNMSGNYHNLLAVPKLNTERYLRYCPLCAKEDRKEYGETYWHRSHQMIGVDICPVHYCVLQNSNALISGKASPRFVTAEEVIDTNYEHTISVDDTEKKLCRYISDVFSLDVDLRNNVQVGDYISFRLSKTKYMTGKMRDMRTLTEDYNRFYNTSTELWRIQKVLTNDDFKLKNICMLAMFMDIKADELCCPILPTTIHKLNRKKIYSEKKPGVRTKDWEEIDCEILPKVKKVIQDFMNTAARPRKISVFAIEKMLNLPSKQINKMPKCKAEILRHYESQQQFWAREAEWAVNTIKADGQTLNWKKIRELTNMRKADVISCLPYMKDSIRAEVEKVI